MAYLFDTNIFIESRKNLPMDVWPTFWTKMVEMINSGNVFSTENVKEEICHGNDELTDWIRNNAPKNFFLPVDANIMAKYSDTLSWAQNNPIGFTSAALTGFAQVADAYLVAAAAATNMTLVTYERSEPFRRNRVKIPDACNGIGVRCCDLNTALKELGISI